ncbi:MAG: hypothetical protein KDL87_04865 [Verrucomicrobiae bacterium]|nr:hypothetical protein [Verrucomicrobiae bacterium]
MLPYLLFVSSRSWRTVDWFLPVLHEIHRRGLARIAVHFTTAEHLKKPRPADLVEILSEFAEIHDPFTLLKGAPKAFRNDLAKAVIRDALPAAGEAIRTRLKSRESPPSGAHRNPTPLADWFVSTYLLQKHQARQMAGRLAGAEVRWLVHDIGDFYAKGWYRWFPDARVAIVPHGTNSLAERTAESDRVDRRKAYYAGRQLHPEALWLLGRQEDEAFYRQLDLTGTFLGCGHPKFDPVWIEHLRQRSARSQSAGSTDSPRSLLLLLMPRSKTTKQSQYDAFVRGVCDLAARLGLRLIIKMHPSQHRREVRRLVPASFSRRVEWCRTSALDAATRSCVAISFPSSTIMDAVVAGIPAIELYDFSNETGSGGFNDGTGKTSLYRLLRLARPANSVAEAEDLVTKLLADPECYRDVCRQQTEALEEIVPRRAGTIERILDATFPG